jgi:hypothetical protein
MAKSRRGERRPGCVCCGRSSHECEAEHAFNGNGAALGGLRPVVTPAGCAWICSTCTRAATAVWARASRRGLEALVGGYPDEFTSDDVDAGA